MKVMLSFTVSCMNQSCYVWIGLQLCMHVMILNTLFLKCPSYATRLDMMLLPSSHYFLLALRLCGLVKIVCWADVLELWFCCPSQLHNELVCCCYPCLLCSQRKSLVSAFVACGMLACTAVRKLVIAMFCSWRFLPKSIM